MQLTNCGEKKNCVSNFSSRDDVTTKVKEVLSEITPINDVVTIIARRNFSFVDFHNFFKKSWNQKFITHAYKFSFIGESGVDTGGLTRDFFWVSLVE